jgi:hypothetical protein
MRSWSERCFGALLWNFQRAGVLTAGALVCGVC